MRVVLAHDWLCGYRGGEAVLDRLAHLLIEDGHEIAALLVMFDDGRPLTERIDRLAHHASWINRLPRAKKLRRWLLPAYPSAVAHLSGVLRRLHRERAVDVVVSTSSAAIKGLRAPEGVPHVCYCHAPARYVWSQRAAYGNGTRGSLRGLGLRLYAKRFRAWDKRTAANVTRFIANSTHTAAEVERCYGREAEVVHPPVRTEFFTPAPSGQSGRREEDSPAPPVSGAAQGDFWLVVSALEPYKRIDLAISAAQRARRRLVIVGTGSQREHLGRLAFSGVQFRERATDEDLRELYRTAEALVFPQLEDFGIVAVEAQACGCPVLARRAGGALDSVVDGVTGAFFEEPSAAAIVEAAGRLPRDCAAACRENALRFSAERFDEGMRAQLRAVAPARS